ncbi:MAG: LacI family DNA-binding transcriptional regulator [Actinobacteria bacterium]|nr:LacI family DNA-binding transcriptional regulator [Actinomycetota bacterium]
MATTKRSSGAQRPPTSHDVAELAGVAQSTVSRALNGDPNISEKTRARVVDAAQRLNYSPNVMARSLITRRANRIGVFLSDITNPFYPRLVECLEREFGALGYDLILFSEGSARGDQDHIDHFLGSTIDGLVFTSAKLDFPLGDRLAAARAPTVFLNRHIDDDRFDRVVSENVAGGRLAGELLVELGHRRIAQISGPPQTSTARDRDAGFQAALEELGATLDPAHYRHGPYTHETGFEGCRSLLAEDPPPTAIFCGNDVIALGAWDAAVSAGLEIPGDLTVVGFDDMEVGSWSAIGLTTIRQPLDQMARGSAELLVGRLNGDYDGPGRVLEFPVEMVRRRTAGPPPR